MPGASVTHGYTTLAGFVAAQDEQGWYDSGDLGYLTETGSLGIWTTRLPGGLCRVALIPLTRKRIHCVSSI